MLAHELIFLARFGSRYNEALVHAGHGETWSGAVMTTLALAIGLVVLGTFRSRFSGCSCGAAEPPTVPMLAPSSRGRSCERGPVPL